MKLNSHKCAHSLTIHEPLAQLRRGLTADHIGLAVRYDFDRFHPHARRRCQNRNVHATPVVATGLDSWTVGSDVVSFKVGRTLEPARLFLIRLYQMSRIKISYKLNL